jgi:hypothetical protein
MADFDMVAVDSSNIDKIGYREETHSLRVLFSSGQLWEYVDVPSDEHRNFMAASSKGRYFNECIRRVYEGRKIS